MYAAGDWSSWLRTCFADVGSSRIRIYRIVVQRPGPQRLFRPCAALFLTQTVRFSPRRALCSLWIVAAEYLACSIEEMISKACSSDDGITLGLDDDKKPQYNDKKRHNKYTERDETPHKERPGTHFKLLRCRSSFVSDMESGFFFRFVDVILASRSSNFD